MAKYLRLFENHQQYESFTQTDEFIKPNVSHCISENDVHYTPIPHDYSKDYLTFVALEDDVSIGIECDLLYDGEYQKISYSLNNGETWYDTQGIEGTEWFATLSNGNKLLVRGTNTKYGGDVEGGISKFKVYGLCNIEGNSMSLIYGDDFVGKTSFPQDSDENFQYLFSGCWIYDASNLILPCTTLTKECYDHMFYSCKYLIKGPKLPATTLSYGCYKNMFIECTNLTKAPELPATALEDYCYYGMLANCYDLEIAPELPATTLASNCYSYMFYESHSLNFIKAMFTTSPSSKYTEEWVNGVASTGTFVKNDAATWDATGVNGIPTGWTVETATA